MFLKKTVNTKLKTLSVCLTMPELNCKIEENLVNKKSKTKQISKSKKAEKIEINIEANANSKDKSTNKTDEAAEVILLDKKNENELTDDLNNSRKNRRWSSANIE